VATATLPAEPSAPEKPAPLKVLIVDDDADVRTVLESLMTMEGFEIVGQAGDGAEAVGIAAVTQPDVVILDFMMPRLDGKDAAMFIRGVAPEARIVAFSGVIHEPPAWADTFIEKGDITQMSRLLEERLSD
jgi:CheY-like chemotaxis protein